MMPTFRTLDASPLDLYPFDSLATAVAPSAPFLFANELANWLRGKLSVGVYPNKLPQKRTSYPLMTYTIVDGDSELRLDGPCGLAWVHVQFDSYSPDYVQSANLDESLRLTLAGFRGAMGAATVLNANKHRPTTGYDPSPVGSDGGMNRCMSEYTIWYRESIPAR